MSLGASECGGEGTFVLFLFPAICIVCRWCLFGGDERYGDGRGCRLGGLGRCRGRC